MNKDNINTVAHRYISERSKDDWIAIDATAGNGNDAYFLCRLAKKVYAFDIQQQAKENTLARCKDFNNLEFHLIGHEHLNEIVKENIHCAIFNFGYLPKSDNLELITKPETSLSAIKQAYNLLFEGGLLVLACYIGHEGGKIEHDTIYSYISSLNVPLFTYQQKENSPILYIIEKESSNLVI